VGPLNAKHEASRRATSTGFTLIEILVVLFVIGIAASLAVVKLSNDDGRDAEREAKRLAGALEHAALLAQWSSETLGVSAEGRTYRFWQRDASDRWNAYTGDEVLAARALPGALWVAPTSYAGAPVPLDAILPFRPSGRNEPYSITLRSPAGQIVVSADPLNRVAFSPLAPAGDETK
jgi:general secretion pathway protein H